MPYNIINSRRIPYDIDGTVLGFNTSSNSIANWCNSTELGNLNRTVISSTRYLDWGVSGHYWFFFPEKVEVENMAISVVNRPVSMQGSNDTTNGVDGTWETAIFPSGVLNGGSTYDWRTKIFPVSFSESKKVIRISMVAGEYNPGDIRYINLYGRKASGETPDDILICDINGNELTALMDWGDRPEGTIAMKSIKIKNTSTTKTANGVNLQLNHADFGMSFSVAGTWTATLDITSISPNGLSEPIYIKNTIGDPPQTLGAKAGRLIATVGNWT